MPLKLVTRPDLDAVQIRETYVCFSVQGETPGALPKGLPAVPNQQPFTWLVAVDLKQWDRVKDSLATDPDDTLLLAGVPVVAAGRAILLAQTCESLRQQRLRHRQGASSGALT
jgi:hypothetical protein